VKGHGGWNDQTLPRRHREPSLSGRGASSDGGAIRPLRRRNGWVRLTLALAGGILIGTVFTLAALALASHPLPILPMTSSGESDVTVTLDDAFLSAALQTGLQQDHLPFVIRHAGAHCVPGGRIVATGQASLGRLPLGIQSDLAMTLQPVAQQGRLHVHVLDASVGALALPSAVNTAIEDALDRQLASVGGQVSLGGRFGPHYVVTGVATTDGHLTLTLGRG
jgi:LmeA-like phospholipid-binding